MKKFTLKTAYLCLPVIIILISVNFYVDPINLFSAGKDEKEMAKYLSEGYNITGNFYYNEWLFQKYYVDYLKSEPDIIILGSSRSMIINSSMFPGELINNSVVGASLEDILAVYSLYPSRNYKPKTIVWGIDPWLLNENSQQLRWSSISDDFYKILGTIGLEKFIVKKIINYSVLKSKFDKDKELFSLSYFQKSLQVFGSKATYKPTRISVNDSITRLVDGSIIFDKKYRDSDSGTVVKSAREFSQNPFSLFNFSKFSERNIEILEKFIDYLEKQNIKLIFFLSPYHPYVYNYFLTTDKYHVVLEAEKYYRLLAKKHNIQIIGSFNPKVYNLVNKDFSDGAHCTASTIKNFFNNQNDSIK